MNRIRKHIGAWAWFYSILIGIAVFCASLGASTALLAIGEQHDVARLHMRSARLIQSISAENQAVLGRLRNDFKPDCREANLVAIRVLLFATRFIKDIGIYDEDGRLVCSTTEGRLPTPFVSPEPTLREIRDGVDQSIWFDVPLVMGNGQYRAVVVRQGMFNAVVDQQALSSQLDGIDILGLQLADALPKPVFVSPRASESWLGFFNEQSASKHPLSGYDWTHHAFVRTDFVDGTPWVLQSYRTLSDMLAGEAVLATFLTIVSVLLGLLVTASAQPWLERQQQIGARIHDLLDREHILCMYQPIVDLRTRSWVGCEVLMRLRDGADLIPPDVALPAILQQKLAWQLDATVIAKALDELAIALPSSPGFRVAFNLLPENIDKERLDELIRPRLAASGRSDFAIDLEVVEQSYDESVITEIERLKQAGYQIAVDDFGTGFSNLVRVKRLAPNLLKIDRSFVFEMEDASVRSSLIPEIVAIARAIGSQVVAEGIENALQAEQLYRLGVEFGQGYYFARPLPIEEFVRGFAEQRHSAAPASVQPATL